MPLKKEMIEAFDPSAPASRNSLFGLPFDADQCDLIIIPVPWEVTVSYHSGTSNAPEAIFEASRQVDLELPNIRDAWTMGIHMLPVSKELKEENTKYRGLATKYIDWLESSEEKTIPENLKIIPRAINEVCEKLNIFIKSQALKHLGRGKIVGLIGGDHSTSLGLINAVTDLFGGIGILQIDAHADLRKSYQDFTYSHASIMYNALKNPYINKLVQVGIRDFCKEEMDLIRDSQDRIVTFFDQDLKGDLYTGKLWMSICEEIVSQLPEKVYISLDVDGLDPILCPNTGTPAPGGLDFYQLIYLIETVVKSGRKIIGFDITEVSPGDDEWDANVAARLLYYVGNLAGVSNGKLSFRA
ncbi:MAG: agmatinase family protein [Bacteroidota bacterium]